MDPMIDCRQRVQAVLNMALGQHIDQEPQKGDGWRSRSIPGIVEHIEREIAEIKRRAHSERLLNDALDLTCLAPYRRRRFSSRREFHRSATSMGEQTKLRKEQRTASQETRLQACSVHELLALGNP